VHNKFKHDHFHFSKEIKYDYSKDAIQHIQNIINKIHKEKIHQQKSDVTILILGLTALLMLLFLSTKKSK
jgi:hypothetical protein